MSLVNSQAVIPWNSGYYTGTQPPNYQYQERRDLMQPLPADSTLEYERHRPIPALCTIDQSHPYRISSKYQQQPCYLSPPISNKTKYKKKTAARGSGMHPRKLYHRRVRGGFQSSGRINTAHPDPKAQKRSNQGASKSGIEPDPSKEHHPKHHYQQLQSYQYHCHHPHTPPLSPPTSSTTSSIDASSDMETYMSDSYNADRAWAAIYHSFDYWVFYRIEEHKQKLRELYFRSRMRALS